MPQPFEGQCRWGLESLKERPKLAVHIAVIAVMWSYTEVILGRLFGAILGTDAEIGLAMYFSIISEAPRRAALKAAIELKLSPVLLPGFEALMKNLAGVRGARNDVVHGIWGIPTDKPDSLVLIDAQKWGLVDAL